MNSSSICPCCDSKMLRHLSNRREYWFCHHCWTEMPELKSQIETLKKPRIVNLSTSSTGVKQLLAVS